MANGTFDIIQTDAQLQAILNKIQPLVTSGSTAPLGFGYGECETAGATAAKTVSMQNTVLTPGGIIAVTKAERCGATRSHQRLDFVQNRLKLGVGLNNVKCSVCHNFNIKGLIIWKSYDIAAGRAHDVVVLCYEQSLVGGELCHHHRHLHAVGE